MNNSMLKQLLKVAGAAAIGAAITAGSAVTVDPAHMKSSLGQLGKVAASGAGGAVIALFMKRPQDQ